MAKIYPPALIPQEVFLFSQGTPATSGGSVGQTINYVLKGGTLGKNGMLIVDFQSTSTSVKFGGVTIYSLGTTLATCRLVIASQNSQTTQFVNLFSVGNPEEVSFTNFGVDTLVDQTLSITGVNTIAIRLWRMN